MKETTIYLAGIVKTKHKENLMESEEYQVQRILLKYPIGRKNINGSQQNYIINRRFFTSIKRNQRTVEICLQSTEQKELPNLEL